MDVVQVFNGNVQMVFEKSWLMSGGSYLSLNDYGGASSLLRVWQTEGRVLREQGGYARQESKTQKNLLNSFVPIQRNGDKKEKVWARKLPLPSWCLMERESDCEELAFAHPTE